MRGSLALADVLEAGLRELTGSRAN
jgi:hypothetical protein